MYTNNTNIISQSSNATHLQQQQQQQQQFSSVPQSFTLPQPHGQYHAHQQYHLDPNLLSNSTPNLPLAQQTSLINNASNIIPKQEMVTPVPEIDKEKEKQARENHCEIERRRRVKMAAYFNELCMMVPTCNTLQRKPDKLTILRMASSHMRNLRGANAVLANNSNSNETNNAYKPSFLTDQELKHLILEAADGFLFVAQCDTGNIIYVSDAIKPVLSYMPNEWSNRSLFDFVHPDDLDKVRDQLSTLENSSNNTTGRILDLKTGTVKKEGHPNSMRSHIGSRRSFICRVKLGMHSATSQHRQIMDPNAVGFWSTTNGRISRNRNTLQTDDQQKPNFSVIHITGYTKVWPPTQANNQNTMYPNSEQANTNFHLIAIARIQMTSAPTDLINSSNAEFVTRHDQNGLVTFVDQRVTNLLGYQPNDLLKKSIFDFVIAQDQQTLKDQLKLVYDTKSAQPVQMTLHFVASANMQNEIIQFKTNAYAFCNPCNEAFEFIVCTHTCQKFNELNNSSLNSNGYNLGNQTLLDQQQADSLQQQYNQYLHYNSTNASAPTQSMQAQMNNYSTQAYSSYQQSNLASAPAYGNYLMMQNMNSNSLDQYNALLVNNATATSNTSAATSSNSTTSASSSSSSTPVSAAGNLNQTLSPSNGVVVAPTSTTPTNVAQPTSSSNTSNLNILQQQQQQRSSSMTNLTANPATWPNQNSSAGYASVDDY